MGGPGSTRWDLHVKKTTVEDGYRLSIGVVSDCDGFRKRIPWRGSIRWTKCATGEECASLGFRFQPNEEGSRWDGRLRLMYTITRPKGLLSKDKESTDIDYWINLETTPCNFGGERWWFRCPLVVNGRACMRRCFKLYLPPGADYYGCRECYDLTYQSAQEAHQFDSLYRTIADQSGIPFEAIKDYFA